MKQKKTNFASEDNTPKCFVRRCLKMENKKLRILFMGDASNYHHALADGLRGLGHEVVVASDGSMWMDTDRDIDISRKGNKISGALLWLKLQRLMFKEFRGFDVVEVKNPIFLPQRPVRNGILFRQLKKHNRSVFLSALGTDTEYIKMCMDPASPLAYNEWMVYGKPTQHYYENSSIREDWLADPLREQCELVYGGVDGAVSALYEYDLMCRRSMPDDKVAYGGIPIDMSTVSHVELPDRPDKVKLFLGMHRDRKVEKGTDRMLAAAKKVQERHPDKCSLEIVENLPYNEYLARMMGSHVVLDQLYSYTPATNALLAMAMGLNTVSGGEEDFYRFIGEKELRPVINALPDDEALYKVLEDVVLHPELLRVRGLQGREFVKKHNEASVVARRFLDFWNRRLQALGR